MIRNKGRAAADDSYATDTWILQLVGPHYDPCPLNANFDQRVDTNGLLTDWVDESYPHNGKIFVNPPYSNVTPWVTKAIAARDEGCTVVMLLKHDSSTQWYMQLAEAGAHFLPIHRRLYFRQSRQASFPSVLVVLEPEPCHDSIVESSRSK
jgi:hypothetical protein